MILLFHADDACRNDVCSAAGKARVLHYPEGAKEECAPIGLLAGERIPLNELRDGRRPAAEELKEPLAVIAGADETSLDKLLANLAGRDRRGLLKAVLTGNNRCWNARQLYGELVRERDQMAKRRS